MAAYGCSQHPVFVFNSLDPPQPLLLWLLHLLLLFFLQLLPDLRICHVSLFLSAPVHKLLLSQTHFKTLCWSAWLRIRDIIQTIFGFPVHFKTTLFFPDTSSSQVTTYIHDNLTSRGRAQCVPDLQRSKQALSFRWNRRRQNESRPKIFLTNLPKICPELGCLPILAPNMPPTYRVSLCV